jgi:hypothetical protein
LWDCSSSSVRFFVTLKSSKIMQMINLIRWFIRAVLIRNLNLRLPFLETELNLFIFQVEFRFHQQLGSLKLWGSFDLLLHFVFMYFRAFYFRSSQRTSQWAWTWAYWFVIGEALSYSCRHIPSHYYKIIPIPIPILLTKLTCQCQLATANLIFISSYWKYQ